MGSKQQKVSTGAVLFLLSLLLPFLASATCPGAAAPARAASAAVMCTENLTEGLGCPPDLCAENTCDDGLWCNGVETCNPETGECVPGVPPDCDDGNACTTDGCTECEDMCVHDPINCDDGAFCNGVETCDAAAGCREGTPPVCEDQDQCTDDVCNEEVKACIHAFDPTNASACGGVCRTAGFWGSRGSHEKDGFNYTQAVIDAAGGCLTVCGNVICGTDELSPSGGIKNLGSALEGLCMRSNDRLHLNQTYRQSIAAALNCVLSGAGANCGSFFNSQLVGVTWEDCNANCAMGSAADRSMLLACEAQLDCLNNGGKVIDLGCGSWSCSTGRCSAEESVACGADSGSCRANTCSLSKHTCTLDGLPCKKTSDCRPNECAPEDSCHERGLCESPIADLLVNEKLACGAEDENDALGPASSSTLCSQARRSYCAIANPSACGANPCGDTGLPPYILSAGPASPDVNMTKDAGLKSVQPRVKLRRVKRAIARRPAPVSAMCAPSR